jgi:hypothetical protein
VSSQCHNKEKEQGVGKFSVGARNKEKEKETDAGKNNKEQ